MIHYALRCGGGHEFDGWFKDSASFDTQSQRGLLDCPICADRRVERALMTPSVRTRIAKPPTIEIPAPANQPGPPADSTSGTAVATHTTPGTDAAPPSGAQLGAHLPPMPDQLRAVLQRMRAAVEKNCDYVGRDFAHAARQMASGEEAPRPIYGEATPEQEAAMEDDGIEFARIPWVPRANG